MFGLTQNKPAVALQGGEESLKLPVWPTACRLWELNKLCPRIARVSETDSNAWEAVQKLCEGWSGAP